MHILAVERDLPLPVHRNLHDLLRDDAAVIWDLQKRSVIRAIWLTRADRRAVVMLECPDAARAREHLATLPLVRAELVDFTLLELCPYDGFERLFAGAHEPAAPPDSGPPEY